jgi:hypothetical protein
MVITTEYVDVPVGGSPMREPYGRITAQKILQSWTTAFLA